ncbi:MAG: LL-diaminopimelate aminotransferase [Candidatus Cloacimonadota bacterium]|nr:MAG: LL-diaminopimelate aminotransferase [Candidatus Cloacimonadota bacterium]
MQVVISNRLKNLSFYPFNELDSIVIKLRKSCIEPIDFGIGDYKIPTPKFIRKMCQKGIEQTKSDGYPSYIGSYRLRSTIAEWTKHKYNVELNPDKEIMVTLGAKEAVFNFPEAFINSGDYVLVPNPGYPPYSRGTLFAEGKVYYLNLTEENDFLPNLDDIPSDICEKAKILWINYPNNPTGKIAPDEFYKNVIEFAQQYNIIICSDETYSDLYFTKKRPKSILEFTKEGVIVFQSLSKRSIMTGYRVGWVAGDERIINAFSKLKTNIDSGVPNFIQLSAIAALKDEHHIRKLRIELKKKMKIMNKAFKSIGLPNNRPDGSIYLWQKIPDNYTAVEFAKTLLEPNIAIITTPGLWLAETVDNINPGNDYIRLALVPSIDECKNAAKRLKMYSEILIR